MTIFTSDIEIEGQKYVYVASVVQNAPNVASLRLLKVREKLFEPSISTAYILPQRDVCLRCKVR